MKYLPRILQVGAFVLCLAQGRSQHPTVEGLLVMLRSQQAGVKSLDVTYRYAEGAPPTDGAYTYKRLAVDSRGRILLETAHGSFKRDWRDWPMRVCHYVVDDAIYTHWPNQLMYTVTPIRDGTLPVELVEDTFFRATGWWPHQHRFPCGSFNGTPYGITQALESGDYASHATASGTTNNLVLRDTNDTIELDIARGMAVRKRRWLNAATGVCMIVRNHDFIDVADGTWWPRRIESLLTVPGNSGAKKTLHVMGQLESLAVNADIEIEIAFLNIPGLARLNQADGSVQQAAPGGREFLDKQIEEVRQLMNGHRPSVLSDTIRLAASGLVFGFALLALRAGMVTHRKPQRTE